MDTAIVQLGSWGDVVISTALVRALKEQCQAKITYYVATMFRGALDGNPCVDYIQTIDVDRARVWSLFDRVTTQARKAHQTVIVPWPGLLPKDKWRLLSGDCKNNFMWAYARAGQQQGLGIEVPLKLWLYPTQTEIDKADQFVTTLNRPIGSKLVMMEMQGHSGQTCFNPTWLQPVIDTVMQRYHNNAIFLISAGGQPPPEVTLLNNRYPGKIWFMNSFSLREMSVIFNYCDLFLGVSSGTSNACQTHRCKKGIAWFETVSESIWDSSPLGTDKKHFHYGGDLGAYIELLKSKLP